MVSHVLGARSCYRGSNKGGGGAGMTTRPIFTGHYYFIYLLKFKSASTSRHEEVEFHAPFILSHVDRWPPMKIDSPEIKAIPK